MKKITLTLAAIAIAMMATFNSPTLHAAPANSKHVLAPPFTILCFDPQWTLDFASTTTEYVDGAAEHVKLYTMREAQGQDIGDACTDPNVNINGVTDIKVETFVNWEGTPCATLTADFESEGGTPILSEGTDSGICQGNNGFAQSPSSAQYCNNAYDGEARMYYNSTYHDLDQYDIPVYCGATF